VKTEISIPTGVDITDCLLVESFCRPILFVLYVRINHGEGNQSH